MNIGGVVSSWFPFSQEMETRHRLLVDDGDLSVENHAGRRERGDCFRETWETAAMVDAAPADKADVGSVLVGYYPPVIDLLLVDPARSVGGWC